jgi:hypothetical protein
MMKEKMRIRNHATSGKRSYFLTLQEKNAMASSPDIRAGGNGRLGGY